MRWASAPRQPSLAGQDGGVQGHVVHPDGVGSRVKGHKFPAQGEQGQDMLFLGRLEEALVVCRRGAVVQALRRKGEQVHQGVEGVRPVLEGQIQQGQVQRFLRGKGPAGVPPGLVGEALVGKVLVEGQQPGLGLLGRHPQGGLEQGQHIPAEGGAMGGEGPQVPGQGASPQQAGGLGVGVCDLA